MNAGRHASQDGSFVRSAGGAMSRGIVLIVIAVLIGVLLIRTAVDDSTVAAAGDSTTDTTAATTDTTAATTDTTAATTDTTAATTDTTDGSNQVFEPRPNAQVRVQVVNTTNVSGAAGGTSDDFKALGYVTLKPTNKGEGQGALALTKIHHVGGYLLEAQQLAAEMGLGDDAVFGMPEAPEALAAEWEDPHILVLLGSDIAGS